MNPRSVMIFAMALGFLISFGLLICVTLPLAGQEAPVKATATIDHLMRQLTSEASLMVRCWLQNEEESSIADRSAFLIKIQAVPLRPILLRALPPYQSP